MKRHPSHLPSSLSQLSTKQALQDAERCLQINPDYIKAYSRKGNALYEMERYTEAKEAFQQGLKVGNVEIYPEFLSFIFYFFFPFQVDGSVRELVEGVENCDRELEMTSSASLLAKQNFRSLSQVRNYEIYSLNISLRRIFSRIRDLQRSKRVALTASPSRHLRVFISSTFLDMTTERDVIHSVVFPAIRSSLAQAIFPLTHMNFTHIYTYIHSHKHTNTQRMTLRSLQHGGSALPVDLR